MNPSLIVLKITSPGKTPDTTTVFDGGPWYAQSRSSMGKLPAPPPISKPKGPMARCTHRGYLRELASDPITRTLITSHCACFQVLDPLTLAPCPRLSAPCAYRLPQQSVGATAEIFEKQYWIATSSCLQHTVHSCILKTLRSRWSSCPRYRGNIHHRDPS